MRIVNKEEFLNLPENTVYSKYEPIGNISGLYIKDQTLQDINGRNADWFYQDLIQSVEYIDSDDLVKAMERAERDSLYEFKNDLNCIERDGFFDPDDTFVIYDKDDVLSLAKKLMKAVEGIRK